MDYGTIDKPKSCCLSLFQLNLLCSPNHFIMGGSNSVMKQESVSKNWTLSKKILGKGSFATVRSAKKKTTSDAERKAVQEKFPDVIAVKIVDKSKARDDEELLLFNEEVEIMARVDNENCVRLVSSLVLVVLLLPSCLAHLDDYFLLFVFVFCCCFVVFVVFLLFFLYPFFRQKPTQTR